MCRVWKETISAWKENLMISKETVSLKLDISWECNVLPLKYLELVGLQRKIKEKDKTIIGYPTGEEIGLKLRNNIFSVFDIKDGFFQIPLSKNSTDMCTFISSYRKYKSLRLSFALSVSPEAFQTVNKAFLEI